jgi:hypothetical protein
MMNPEKLVEDLFDDKNLSDANLQAFTDDAMLRLSIPDNNPGGIYTTIIGDTNLKYTAFFGIMNNEMAKEAISEGLTIATYNAKDEVLEILSRLQNLVKFLIGEKSPIYQEFYPLGMTEYITAKIDELKPLLTRYVTAATTHLSASNPLEVNELVNKVNAFEAARLAQQTTFAEVDSLKTGRREDRKALTLQLTLNMLIIAGNNLENPDNYNNYYNPSYLPLSEKQISVSGIINAATIVNAVAKGVITQSSTITMYNQGTDELIFSLNNQPNIIHSEHQITVAPGNNHRFDGNLPVFDQYFLNVQNPHPTNNGKWKVVVG